MISEHTIYCVGCSCVVPRENAEKAFRTGYYRVTMRLGICSTCAEKDMKVETSGMLGNLDEWPVAERSLLEYE